MQLDMKEITKPKFYIYKTYIYTYIQIYTYLYKESKDAEKSTSNGNEIFIKEKPVCEKAKRLKFYKNWPAVEIRQRKEKKRKTKKIRK